MAYKKIENLNLGNARIIYRNFSGKPTPFSKEKESERSFCVIIDDPVQAQNLTDEGWNVRIRPARDEEEETFYYLPVAVRYDNIPPMIYFVTSKAKILLDETTVSKLDGAVFKNVDLIIHPSFWEVNGKSGIKAYLQTMYAEIEEDPFAAKYEVRE